MAETPLDFPPYCADCTANLHQATHVVFGVPFGKTTSFRPGAEQAPAAIRQASWNFETFDLRTQTDLTDGAFHDAGDLELTQCTTQEMIETVRSYTKSLLNTKKIPIALGGEHSITPGIVQAYPKDIAVLVLDAHLDYRDSYDDDRNNHACAVKRIADHLPVDHIAVIGVRSAEQDEYDQALKDTLFYRDAYTIRKRTLAPILNETLRYLGDTPLFLSMDIDVLDPAYAPATSTPEPFGLTPFDLLDIIDRCAPHLIGADIVEVCPPYDHGQTALLAAKLLRILLQKIG